MMLIHLLPIRHLTSMEPPTLQDQTNASVIPVTHCLQMHVYYRPTNLYHYNNNLNELWSGTLSSKKSQISPPFSSFFSSSLGGSGGGIRGVLPLKIDLKIVISFHFFTVLLSFLINVAKAMSCDCQSMRLPIAFIRSPELNSDFFQFVLVSLFFFNTSGLFFPCGMLYSLLFIRSQVFESVRLLSQSIGLLSFFSTKLWRISFN